MKIGIYDPYLDDMGGGEKYMLSIASCLSSEHAVTLFWNTPEDLDKVNSRFTMDLSKVTLSANIFSPKVSSFRRAIESKKYDALIVLSDGSIPFVLSKYLYLHIQQPIPGGKTSAKTRLKLLRTSNVFCNSFYSKSFVDRQLGVESAVIYPPVELHPVKCEKQNIILHVGRFRASNVGTSDYKKQDVMVDAFKKISKKLGGWKFVLAVGIKDGDEGLFTSLKKKTEGYPIEFEINKTSDELWRVYSKAKIYWHATGAGEDLNTHPEYAEHFGISTVEAMGAGVVPVVINAGGQKEIVEDNISGLLWDTLEDLENKTIQLVENKKMLETLSVEAKKRAEYFAGHRFCNEVKKLIKA